MQKRAEERVLISKEVIINKTVRAEGLDLSEEGMYLYTTKSGFIQGSIINLRFKLGSEVLNLSGKVQHSEPGIGIGVRFIGLTDEIKEKIKNYIKLKNYIAKKSVSKKG